MSDQYYSAIQEQWSNIRGLYMAYGSKKPIMSYNIHEKKIYAYPYKEFKAELSEKIPSVSGNGLQVDICSWRHDSVCQRQHRTETGLVCDEH